MGFIKSVLLVLVLAFNLSNSQTIVGKIYSKGEADIIYGPVVTSIQISSSLLNNLTNVTTNYIMFSINNGNLHILGDQRKPLYPDGIAVDPQTEMRLFSVSLVRKIIIDGNNPYTTVEIRNNNVLTITNGNYTLEFSWLCPPNCDSN